ncbi:hypothetical protein VTI28DRAFT_2284 [Corynascus sepedonium]
MDSNIEHIAVTATYTVSGSGNINNNYGGKQFNAGVMYVGAQAESDACLQSLAFPDMDSRSQSIEAAAEGTCGWLLQHNTYKLWASSDKGLLWIKGKAGSGKSTLLRYAIDNGIATDAAGKSTLVLSFFFHGRGTELQKSPLGLFRSLLHQLVSHAPEAKAETEAMFTKRCKDRGKIGEAWQWTLGDLHALFEHALEKVLKTRSVCLYVDALDECGTEDAEMLLRNFETLLRRLPNTASQFRACFTCRPFPAVFQDHPFEISLGDENADDIAIYVKSRFSISPTLDASAVPATVIDRASGVFLWARLMVDKAMRLHTEGVSVVKISRAVKATSGDLDQVYLSVLDNIRGKPQALNLLQWVCFSSRPLRVGELRLALVLGTDGTYNSLQDVYESEEFIQSAEDLERRVCSLGCGLIEIAASSPLLEFRTVQFIHQSVKEFFITKGLSVLHGATMSSAEAARCAHRRLYRASMLYLSLNEVSQSPIQEGAQLMLNFPFLHYATTSWMLHAKYIGAKENQERQQNTGDDFVRLTEDFVQAWVRVYSLIDPLSDGCPPQHTSMLHIFVRYQLISPLQSLLLHVASSAACTINPKDDRGRTPLSYAAEDGDVEIVQLLLSTSKADVNTTDGLGRTPLSYSAIHGHHSIAQLLLTTGAAEVDTTDIFFQTPLSNAAEGGHDAIVDLLIKTGKVDVNARSISGKTPLLFAAANGHETVVRRLLATSGVEIDARSYKGRTPLSYAASNGHETIVKLLLETGAADVNSRDSYVWLFNQGGRTPLSYAAEKGHVAIVHQLLEVGGAEPDLGNGEYGQTPLWWAAANGREEVVRLLLATGKVDVNARDQKPAKPPGGIVGSWTAKIGDWLSGAAAKVAHAFVGDQFEANCMGRTPLSLAAEMGQLAIVDMLLAAEGIDVNAMDDHNRNPLRLAAKHGHASIVHRLLATGKADINARDAHQMMPLMWALRMGHEHVVALLVMTGQANVNEGDMGSEGQTAMLWAARNGRENMVLLLLMMGQADVNVRDTTHGQTPLAWAARGGHERIVQLLLASGKANVDLADVTGRRPLEWAAEGKHDAIAELLDFATRGPPAIFSRALVAS